jgi:hypothetical protein
MWRRWSGEIELRTYSAKCNYFLRAWRLASPSFDGSALLDDYPVVESIDSEEFWVARVWE